MADETHEAHLASQAHGRGKASGRTPTVFVTDGSADGARIADALRMAGYLVVDVPLAMLVTRAQAERPNVVLVDADAASALEEAGRLRRVPGAGAIDFVYFGSGAGPIKSVEDAMSNEGSAFFPRPVDAGALLRRLEALTGGPVPRAEVKRTPPPSPSREASSDRPSSPSLPSPGLRTPGPPLPMSVSSLADLVDPPFPIATFATVSNELQQLLAEAELRAGAIPDPDVLPTPEEEIEAVLPADVLASLDEPIEGDEDEEHDSRGGTGPGHDREGGTGRPTTVGGTKQTTASTRSAPPTQTHAHTNERRVGSEPLSRELTPSRTLQLEPQRQTRRDVRISSAPPVPAAAPAVPAPASVELRPPTRPSFDRSPRAATVAQASTAEASPSTDDRNDGVSIATLETLSAARAPARGPSAAPSRESKAGSVIGSALDARRFVADAISRRLSGAICFEYERVVRRLVVRDGDLVTAASGAERESLVCFLGARGELPRDEVDRLSGKVPPYGRHAGAALVAHGWLGQDQLWTALRAHAEWIAALVLRLGGGTVQLEPEPPGRLRSEPSVFAASTGAEIFVELVRRAVSPEEAIVALGGEASRIGDGPAQSLLAECALAPAELELVSRARGATLGELLGRSPDVEIASVVHGLALLGVLEVVPAAEPSHKSATSSPDVDAAALDDEAIRARVRARLELVEEGDYFSVLGVARDATSYEVRRAFVELRRAFEPTRILTPRLADLAGDVRKIVVVLEEAYEILRDVARRERYRRAIEARPG